MTSNASISEPALSCSPRETQRGRRRHLVIADDCAEMRQFVRDAVGLQFDDVIEVADGRALFWALLRSSFAAANATAPELVLITDVAMPVYDGLLVLDAWRDAQHCVPTIVITASPSEAVRVRAQDLGVTVLAKPFSITKLRQLVHDVFEVAGTRYTGRGGQKT